MITFTPKIVHYVWVGGRPKPPRLEARLRRWREVLPGYEIREWNEQSLDLTENRYAREALEAGAFAFVSDYVRLVALSSEGGVYCDTDVEILKPFDQLLDGLTSFGFEVGPAVATSTIVAAPGCAFIAKLLRGYKDRAFFDDHNALDMTTNVSVLTRELLAAGLRLEDREQQVTVCGMTVRIFPSNILSPYDYLRGIDGRDAETIAVHLFEGSWLSWRVRFRTKLGFWVRRVSHTFKRPVPADLFSKKEIRQ